MQHINCVLTIIIKIDALNRRKYLYMHKIIKLNLKKIKSVAYSSQGSHIGQLDFCNWLADSSMTG